ncbi:hypothetical protein D3C78_1315810 [compost metagenome]
MLRHRRIREDLGLRFIGRSRNTNPGNHVVLGRFRITNRFNIQQRLVRRAGEQQLAFTHNQILTVSVEAPFRNIDLPVKAKPLLVLRYFQVARQSRLQAKRIEAHVVPNMNDQVTVNRDPGAFWLSRFQIVIQHHFIA